MNSGKKVNDKYSAIRFVTSWATKKEHVDEFLKDFENYVKNIIK